MLAKSYRAVKVHYGSAGAFEQKLTVSPLQNQDHLTKRGSAYCQTSYSVHGAALPEENPAFVALYCKHG